MRKSVEVRDTSNRRQKISALLLEDGSVQVRGLSKQFGVSTQTIRKDLLFLEQRGVATRSYGGAMVTPPSTIAAFETGVDAKRQIRAKEKEAIGRLAASLIRPGASIILDSGTTTAQIARFLPDTDDITVVINDFGVLQELALKKKLNVVMLGGALRRKNMAFYGGLTEAAMAGLVVDIFFLGVDGLDAEHGITTHHEAEALLNRTMARVASQVIAVTDSSKFGRKCLHRILDVGEIDILVTDAAAPKAAIDRLDASDVKVMIA